VVNVEFSSQSLFFASEYFFARRDNVPHLAASGTTDPSILARAPGVSVRRRRAVGVPFVPGGRRRVAVERSTGTKYYLLARIDLDCAPFTRYLF
jgi:hypothetical protein